MCGCGVMCCRSFQFKEAKYLSVDKIALFHPVCHTFVHCYLWNSLSLSLIHCDPASSFHSRSKNSVLCTPPSSGRSMKWCFWLCAPRQCTCQVPQHSQSFEMQATRDSCRLSAANMSACRWHWHSLSTSVCPGQEDPQKSPNGDGIPSCALPGALHSFSYIWVSSCENTTWLC